VIAKTLAPNFKPWRKPSQAAKLAEQAGKPFGASGRWQKQVLPDATIMAVAGHLDRSMMEHYSHVRKAAKRDVLGRLESGLMQAAAVEAEPPVEKVN
jgi:hypothetical protein